MKKMIIFGLFFALTYLWAANDNAVMHLDGNRLNLSTESEGAISAGQGLAAEWPNASGHEYLETLKPFFITGAGQAAKRISWKPAPVMHGNLYFSSLDKANWPPEWNGVWPGYHENGSVTGDLAFYAEYENKDLGLKMVVYLWQWSQFTVQNMAVEHIEIKNTGTEQLNQLSFGLYTKTNVGGDLDADNISLQDDAVHITDTDGRGSGRGIAKNIGSWKTGFAAIDLIESPEINHDGIDNDDDGMIDESRFDGIDNDGDWNPATDDVGADGIANTGDVGEGDGLPTLGEPNFDITDWDESETVNSSVFNVYDSGQPSFDNVASSMLKEFDPLLTSGTGFINFSGNFSLNPGETKRATFALVLSEKQRQEEHQLSYLEKLRDMDYQVMLAPPRPELQVVAENKKVTLYWDSSAENWPGFEGYKIYKSNDPGFNDVFTITDDHGVKSAAVPIKIFDLNDGIKNLFPANYYGYRYYLGKDSGLRHSWIDNNVNNGQKYYYAIVAYTTGDADRPVFPTESLKRIWVNSDGELLNDVNTRMIMPHSESLGFSDAEAVVEHTNGISTATVGYKIIDRTKVRENAVYQITFDDTTSALTTFSVTDITHPDNPLVLVQNSTEFSDNGSENENLPLFDGLRFILKDDEIAWNSSPDETKWITGKSNWDIQLVLNGNLGVAVPVAADYEVRFGKANSDTALFTTPIPVPFQVWNVTDPTHAYKENLLVLDQNGNGAWDSGELIYIVKGNTLSNFKPIFWSIILSAPADSTTSIPPVDGDIAQIHTFKPFTHSDVYHLKTAAMKAEKSPSDKALDNVAVVPNPYIIHSAFESKSLYSGGQVERSVHFINLPISCSIKIFNLRGRLLRSLAHHSSVDNGVESWDLKDSKGQTASYGIYIFFIDVPGGGKCIGRFAIIR